MMQILIAGFGGQGILFTGKVIAHAGMMAGMEVTWLPSYGPEMRGGTANCSVCLSDRPIGCPLVIEPDVLVAMNTPSYVKFIGTVRPGGKVFVDSSLVDRLGAPARADIDVFELPATQLAQDEALSGLSNIILLGQVLKNTAFVPAEVAESALEACVPERRAHLRAPNLAALRLGMR